MKDIKPKRRIISLLGFILLALFITSPSHAHEVRPAYLGITELAAGEFDLVWKLPLKNQRPLPIKPILPERCTVYSRQTPELTRTALIERWQVHCGVAPFEQERLSIEGLDRTLTDTLVNLRSQSGALSNHIVKPAQPFVLWSELSNTQSALPLVGYLWLGIEHLLLGFDHILFVIGLLFFITRLATLLKTVTAFTVAHSITLALSSLNIINLSPAPVEAVIALSILCLVIERLRVDKGEVSLMQTMPWLIAFVFGLLHGFGFAGALRDIGLPEESLGWALLLFNIGVEVGQLVVIAVVLLLVAMIKRVSVVIPRWMELAPVMGMGVIAGYWVIDRHSILLTIWS